jgi:chromosomal replication initiator protein
LLNPKFTFSDFVNSKSNFSAYSAGLLVAEKPGVIYNPLFIYGGTGLGKTHLLNAIGHHAIKIKPELNVVYRTAENFTNDLIDAIKSDGNEMINFRKRYRTADILLIDDIQLLVNKERTQEEFFHTFNNIYSENKQIIVSCDRSVEKLSFNDNKLKNYLQSGLVVEINLPDIKLRTTILQNKLGSTISTNIINYIAEATEGNSIRDIEGIITQIVAFSFFNEKIPTQDNIKDIIKPLLKNEVKQVFINKTITLDNFINSFSKITISGKIILEDFNIEFKK